ncbi:Isopentenyl-diphosphate Delta-isomerase 2, partial [Tetrabaena socialis]
VAPGQWDLSAAEHLAPGESFRDGALRGLAEELGVELSAEQQREGLRGPLAPTHQRRLLIPDKGIQDFEFVEAYRVDGWAGPISFNEQEVSECRWVSLAQLRADMAARPDDFTIWFREEVQSVGFFGMAG